MKMADYEPAVLLSLKPAWWRKMLYGQKTLEIRKSYPHLTKGEFTVYVYCTKPVSRVVGCFECWAVERVKIGGDYEQVKDCAKRACLTPIQMRQYAGTSETLAGWTIHNQKIFTELVSLKALGKTAAPQSWQYIDKNRVEALLQARGIRLEKVESEAGTDESGDGEL